MVGESSATGPIDLGDLTITPERRFDALRFDQTAANRRRLEAYHESFGKILGDVGLYRCQFTSTIVAKEMSPPHVCPNNIEWAVLAPGDYYYKHEGYGKGDTVPLEERGV